MYMHYNLLSDYNLYHCRDTFFSSTFQKIIDFFLVSVPFPKKTSPILPNRIILDIIIAYIIIIGTIL